MLTLCLLRHAKSDWDDFSLRDHDRPLSARGRAAATLMGSRIARMGVKPDIVLCSTAVRARETLNLVSAAASLVAPVMYDGQIYGAGAADLLAIIMAQSPSVSRLMMVGHNPGFHDLALTLMGRGEPGLVASLRYKLPTGTLVVLDFDAARFADIAPGTGHLTALERPADQTLA